MDNNSSFPVVQMVIVLAIAAFEIYAMWRLFEKANQPGWAAIVPIYNFYILLKLAGKPGWWILLLLVPFVNFVIAIIAMIAVAKAFGKGTGFGLGLAFFGGIFVPVLAFSDAKYQGAPA